MEKLLKDMPEFAERIEDSYLFREDIKDALNEHVETFYEKTRDTHFDEVNAINEDDFGTVTETIIQLLIEFVNQNYQWKGNKS